MAEQEKTEQATPKKKRDERKKGNVFSSKDIIAVCMLLIMFFALEKIMPHMYETISKFLTEDIESAISITEITYETIKELFVECVKVFAMTALPLLMLAGFIAIMTTGIQTRFLFATESLKPDFKKLDPIAGTKRFFSLKSVIEVLKNVIKIVILSVIIYNFFKDNIGIFFKMPYLEVTPAVVLMLQTIMKLIVKICIAFVAIAAADYMYQRWDYNRNLKMSKQEVKEEYKQQEGDPQVKGKIKQIQRQMAMSRMMQEVPTADVVIRNPTHYAIAMRYDINKDNAPIVVAKGRDEVALRIVSIAAENEIYVLENKELTRALYPLAELDSEIPLNFYNAIAEIFALVYSTKEKGV